MNWIFDFNTKPLAGDLQLGNISDQVSSVLLAWKIRAQNGNPPTRQYPVMSLTQFNVEKDMTACAPQHHSHIDFDLSIPLTQLPRTQFNAEVHMGPHNYQQINEVRSSSVPILRMHMRIRLIGQDRGSEWLRHAYQPCEGHSCKASQQPTKC